MKTHLLAIDPQNDFCDPRGSLFVPGADQDMERLTAFLVARQNRIDAVHVTLDSHLPLHIAHPAMWRGRDGEPPAPFTVISAGEVQDGVWRTRDPMLVDTPDGKIPYALYYTRELEKGGRYQLCIWPPHCLIGGWGACVHPSLHQALNDWQIARFAQVDYLPKGANMRTEHYSAVRADVEDPADPGTRLNERLIRSLGDLEVGDILVAGEALSHCVANTVTDLLDALGADGAKKLVLLEDASSNVPGFESAGAAFVESLTARGMRVTRTSDYG